MMSLIEELEIFIIENNISQIEAMIEIKNNNINILSYKRIETNLEELKYKYEIIHLTVNKKIPFIKSKQ
jgi:hypothetical protein